MITTAFNGPAGSAIRTAVVVPLARAQRGRITVVSPLREVLKQWQKLLPGCEYLTMREWQKRADDPAGTLVIVDGIRPDQFPNYSATLSTIKADVWLVGLEEWELPEHVRQVFSRRPLVKNDFAPLPLDHDPVYQTQAGGQEGGAA